VENLLSVGDCVGLAIRQCRRDVKFLAMKLLLPSVIELVGKLFLVSGARVFLASLHGGIPGPETLSALGPSLIGFLICIPAEVWLTMLQLSYVRMVVNQSTDFNLAFKQVRHKFWAVILYAIGYYAAFFVWVFAWAFMFGIASFLAKVGAGGAGGAIVMVPVILAMIVIALINLVLLLLPASVLFVVLACEDKGFFQIIGRAYAMTFKRLFPTAGFCCVLFVTWMALFMALTSVLQIFYGAEYMKAGVYTGKKHAGEIQMPLYVQIIGGSWNSIIYMYLMPVFFLASGYYYYSLRMRLEGLDISNGIELLEQKRRAVSG